MTLTFAQGMGRTSPAKTQLTHSYATAPLKVQRPFPQEDGSCQVVMLHTAGGMVGGDRLVTSVHLKPSAQVLLTTAAATKVYRSNGFLAGQTVALQVEAQAVLEWLPQETIVFNQAQYRQDLRIELGAGAQVLLWEVTRLGRSARGESFVAGDWRSLTEVWQGGKPLWIDRQWLPGSWEIWHSSHGLAGYPVVGTLVWVGQTVHPDQLDELRQRTGLPSRQAGMTRLPGGLLCRYRAMSTAEVRAALTQIWQWIRTTQWGRSASVPRVWL